LSTVRASTPKFYRTELKNAMNILIDGDIDAVIKYMDNVKQETENQKPENISINVGVSSLDYTWEENIKKFRKWTGEKYLSAPVNSRAALIHNKYVENKDLKIKDIEPSDKISFLYMKVPNPLFAHSNVFGFRESKIFEDGLNDYIDRNTMYEKGFLTPIKLITDPLKWDITPKDEQILDDEW